MDIQDFLKYMNEQVLECAICMQPYKKPKSLPCLHVFCSDCIERHINLNTTRIGNNRYYTCPTCKERYGAGTTKLRVAFVYNSLLEVSRLIQKKTVPCSSCASNHDAVAACPTCGDFFCAECKDKHESLSLTRAHTLYPISELSDATKLAKFQKSRYALCPHHEGESCKLFCNATSCMIEICHICTYGKHKEHPIVPLEEKLEEYKQVIEAKLPIVKNNLRQLSDQKKMLEAIRNRVKKNEDSAMQHHERRGEEISEMVKLYQRKVTDKIKTESEKQQENANTILKSVNAEIRKVDTHLKVGDHLNKLPVSSALQMAREFIASSREIQSVKPIDEAKVKANSPGLSFIPSTLTYRQIHPTFASMMGVFLTPIRVDKDIDDIKTNMPKTMGESVVATIKEAVWESREWAGQVDDSCEHLAEMVKLQMETTHGGDWNCVAGTTHQVHIARTDTQGYYFTGVIDGKHISVFNTPTSWSVICLILLVILMIVIGCMIVIFCSK